MLRDRLIVGGLMIVALIAVLGVDQRWAPHYPALAVVAVVVGALSARELAALVRLVGLPVDTRSAIAGSLVILLTNWLLFLRGGAPGNSDLAPALIALALVTLATLGLAAWRYDGEGKPVLAIAGHVLIFFYVGVLGTFVVQARWLGPTSQSGALALAMTIFTPKFGDIGAFFTGRSLGRTKMAPRLSPGKTWEGIVGGLVASVGLAILMALVGQYGSIPGPGIAAAALFGLVVGVSGPIGDLVESLVKREGRQKDASHDIPGFGGMLDVVDSVLFTGPIAYLMLRAMI